VAVALALVTVVSTTMGGLVALRLGDRLHLVLGLAAGVMLGVVAFELLPEITRLSEESGQSLRGPMIGLVGGFFALHVAERGLALHKAHEGEYEPHHHHPEVGVLSASALVAHSFCDGLGIGLAFQAGTTVGATVAIAVIAHDFADGLNTVSVMVLNRNDRRRTLLLLSLDALAPLAGVLVTLAFTLSEGVLRIYLGVFAGILLYLATSDILPEAHARHPSRLTFLATGLGAAAMLVIAGVSP
jgi:ZIP family zinc transporter